VTGQRGKRGKQLLDGLKGKRRYCKLKEEALDWPVWRIRFGRGYGRVVKRLQNKGILMYEVHFNNIFQLSTKSPRCSLPFGS
jgi:hypothetical protein